MAGHKRAAAAQPTQFDASALLAQSTPHIDLNLPSLRAAHKDFLSAVSAFAARGTAEMARRADAHTAETRRLQERAQALEKETGSLKLAELALLDELKVEEAQRKEVEARRAEDARRTAALEETIAAEQAEVARYRALVGSLRREREAERATLQKQAQRVAHELEELENAIGLKIQGVAKHQLLFQFHCVRGSPSFVLDVSTKDYQVLTISPNVPTLPTLLAELNKSRNLSSFVRAIERAFRRIADA
ncbi:unnamed protein product [Peniophora sp. CBMAI 1063]|nr:unnamed protein product [Peniophora sp. CBMAI 1063]